MTCTFDTACTMTCTFNTAYTVMHAPYSPTIIDAQSMVVASKTFPVLSFGRLQELQPTTSMPDWDTNGAVALYSSLS